MKVLAIIGARSGSKGLPNKNIKLLKEKPLLHYIIEASQKSNYINRIILSTDSKEYADLAAKKNIETPFLRPKELAADFSPEIDYIKYTLNKLKDDENYIPDIVIRLFPTVPFQTNIEIDKAIEKLISNKSSDSCVVVAKARQHPEKALKINEFGKLVSYISNSGKIVTPIARQNYQSAYFRGNVIVSKYNTIINQNSLTGNIVEYVEIPQERALDIDSEFDFIVAEKLFNHIKKIK